MRHNENIKRMLVAGLLTLGAWNTDAQVVANSWNDNSGSGLWSNGNNWLLATGTKAVPNKDFGEYASISNGSTSNLTIVVSEEPLAVVLGESSGTTGTLVVGATGELNIDGSNFTQEQSAFRGQLVIGNEGTGLLTMNGGKITTTHGFVMSRLAGGAGTFNMHGGVVETSGDSFIGAGGGEAASWAMTAGTFNQNGNSNMYIGGYSGGQGTLNMSGGSEINIENWSFIIGGGGGGNGSLAMSGTATLNSADNVIVGDATDSVARLEMGGAASIVAGRFEARAGEANSVIELADQASITVNNQIFDVSAGTLRVKGHEVNISTTNLKFGGTYNPEINSNGASVIHATGQVVLGGKLALEFDGVTPSVNDSWKIVDGASGVLGAFDVITGPELSGGVRYAVSNSGGDVSVNVESALTLNINTVAGQSSIIDIVGGQEVIAYMVKSKSGLLNTSKWKSLQDQNVVNWEESNPTAFQAAELNLHSSMAFTAGQKHTLGGLIGNISTSLPFGQSIDSDEFSLEYKTADNITHSGILNVEGFANNFVLTIDSETGEAVLRNHSFHSVDLIGYLIESAAGSLDVSGWDSLEDQGLAGWDESNPLASQIAELLLEGSMTIGKGEIISLGKIMSAEALEDLALHFRLADGETMAGIVRYDDLPVEVSGDYDWDGDVDENDLAIVKNGFGSTYDLSDLAKVRNASPAATAMIPEPASISLMALVMLTIMKRKK